MSGAPVIICPLPGCGERLEYSPYDQKYFCPLCGRFYLKPDLDHVDRRSMIHLVENKSCSTNG